MSRPARSSRPSLALAALGALALAAAASGPIAAQEADAAAAGAITLDAGGADPGADAADRDAGVAERADSAADASIDGGPSDDAGVPDAGGTDDASFGDGGGVGESTEQSLLPLPADLAAEVTAAIASPTTTDVGRTLAGLVALLALAWFAGHERVRRAEERLGIAPLMMSGLPFVLLGLLARAPGIAILNDEVVVRLTPLLQFGLGWIGFHTGFQLDPRSADRFPRGSASLVILLTGVPLAFVALTSVVVLRARGLDPEARSLVRDAILLGLAGALSAPAVGRLAATTSKAATDLIRSVGVLDDVVGVVAFAGVAAWLRPGTATADWVLPEVGWVFVTFGIASVLGLLTALVLRGTDSSAEKVSLLLGAVCLTTGVASVFSLPPLVVCFLAGVVLRNLPGDDKDQLEASFALLERPIYHLFLLIVGALWRPESGTGWILMPAFVAARTLGRWTGARLARRLPAADRPDALDATSDVDLTLAPMGQLAIAFVITAQTLYESEAVRAMVTTVVGGAVVLEVLFHLVGRRSARGRVPAGPRDPEP